MITKIDINVNQVLYEKETAVELLYEETSIERLSTTVRKETAVVRLSSILRKETAVVRLLLLYKKRQQPPIQLKI
ncbi:hypothetical protein CEXT_3861 [Caerostris extrusa]|uniref:Uncharacterized protein n=1 Tax=Caerostris extrusa TaxID=172846 RepID=A0AAV4RHP9_CAEEX|nr:hypothetical protein CEXT_3861 [Caerostris extrusa]